MFRQQRAAVAPEEGTQNERDVGHCAEERHEEEESAGEPAPPRAELPRRGAERPFGGSGGGPPQRQPCAEVEQRGDEEHQQHEGVGQRIGFEFGESVEDLYRGHPVEAEHQRGAEFGETPHQHQTASRQHPRPDQRQRDRQKASPATRAEVRRRLVEGGVEVAERGDEVEVEDRVEVERFDEADREEASVAAEEIDGGESAAAQQRIDHAVVTEDRLESKRADEGRQDHRQHHRKIAELLAGEFPAVVDHRERERDHEDDRGGAEGDPQAVPESFEVDRIAEDLRKKAPVAADFDDRADGEKQKDAEKRDKRREREILPETTHHEPHLPALARRSASR